MNNAFKRPQQKSSSFAKTEEQLEEQDISTNIYGSENIDFNFTKNEEKRQIRIWIEENVNIQFGEEKEKPSFFMGIILPIIFLVLFSYFAISANENKNLGTILLSFVHPFPLIVFLFFVTNCFQYFRMEVKPNE